ncbi:hypothetical protein IC229_01110 [Spirosoma sp. BT702]|uniref:DUF4136 domain-containing protein n=1 Tax=Spirosoma profusum TaxID=2771354 RepID=A0A926XSM7_9BACT|nr:hypothetical protein [Spirosoma profusum]MBD2699214.1 hypothetical protein [Spirosoma profusum]
MKTLFTALLIAVSFGAIAQRSSSKHVTTDGRQLRIRVDIEDVGRSVHFNASFNVAEMEASAVKALEYRIVDSLEQATAAQTMVASNDPQPEISKKKSTCTDKTAQNNFSYEFTTEANSSPTFSPSDVAPASVRVQEDKENGRLWMQYTFEKDGEELIIERTANVTGKSEREKQAIIKETERSFGIKLGNQ